MARKGRDHLGIVTTTKKVIGRRRGRIGREGICDHLAAATAAAAADDVAATADDALGSSIAFTTFSKNN